MFDCLRNRMGAQTRSHSPTVSVSCGGSPIISTICCHRRNVSLTFPTRLLAIRAWEEVTVYLFLAQQPRPHMPAGLCRLLRQPLLMGWLMSCLGAVRV